MALPVAQICATNHINKLNSEVAGGHDESTGNVPDKNHAERHETTCMAAFDSA